MKRSTLSRFLPTSPRVRRFGARSGLVQLLLCVAVWAGVLTAAAVVAPAFSGGRSVLHGTELAYAAGVRTAADPTGGFWTSDTNGQVLAHDGAPNFGSLTPGQAGAPIMGMAATPNGRGYWLADADGDVYPFGDAARLPAQNNAPSTSPVVGITATPDGRGTGS